MKGEMKYNRDGDFDDVRGVRSEERMKELLKIVYYDVTFANARDFYYRVVFCTVDLIVVIRLMMNT